MKLLIVAGAALLLSACGASTTAPLAPVASPVSPEGAPAAPVATPVPSGPTVAQETASCQAVGGVIVVDPNGNYCTPPPGATWNPAPSGDPPIAQSCAGAYTIIFFHDDGRLKADPARSGDVLRECYGGSR